MANIKRGFTVAGNGFLLDHKKQILKNGKHVIALDQSGKLSAHDVRTWFKDEKECVVGDITSEDGYSYIEMIRKDLVKNEEEEETEVENSAV